MALWENIIPALYRNKKESTPQDATTRAVGGNYAAVSAIGGHDVDATISRHYERVLWCFRCVDSIATKLSNLDIIFQEGKGLNAKETNDIDLDRVLNRIANSYETGQAFRYRVYSLGLLSVRGVFIEIVRSAAGTISQLHVLPPGRVEPIPDPENYVAGYWVSNGVDGRDFLRPDQVLWIKLKPHPTDPYKQMTPMVAAGLAADTDFLARIYNRNFLMNDGRPGMLITVQDLQPDDASILKRRFSGGGNQAGVVSIIEGNGIDIADMSTNPRDVQWLEAISGSRDDILAAFGVPMIAFGSSSEKTFDNADAESVSYWTETLNPAGKTYGSAFDQLTPGGLEDDIHVLHDTSVIYALQQVERDRVADLQNEVMQGLRTINSYLEETGQDRVPYPEAEVLWITPGRLPVGEPNAVKKILDAMGQLNETFMPPQQMNGEQQQQPRQIGNARRALPGAPSNQNNLRQLATSVRQQGNQLAQLSKALPPGPGQRTGNGGTVKRPRQHKSAPATDKESDADSQVFEMKQSELAIEALFYGMVESWDERLLATSDARLNGYRARKDTRHWDYKGEVKAIRRTLDSSYVVNRDKWIQEMQNSLMPLLNRVVDEEAKKMIDEYQLGDDIDLTPVLDALKKRVIREATNRTDVLEDIISEAERRGQPIQEISKGLSGEGRQRRWVQPFVTELTTQAVEGARDVVAQRVGGMYKTWRTSADDRVRASHRRLNGRTVKVSSAFNVGGVKIKRPGDPEAPIGETINCRCRLEYRVKR